ncbi:MAG: ferrochelatase [Arachnia sp.]
MASSTRVGVVLSNLGTPDGTDYRSMRRFLGEFLSDRRVIDYHPILWQPLLQGIILSTRPRTSAALYRQVWDTQLDEGPLLTRTRRITDAIRHRLRETHGENLVVDFAMRYSNPATGDVLTRMLGQGCQRIVYFPLYPQYSSTTVATAQDELFRVLSRVAHQPSVRTIGPYWEHPGYVAALAASVREAYRSLNRRPERLIVSYHGLPERYTSKGDPYESQCRATSAALAQQLGMESDELVTTFQSKFGPERWLGPATIDQAARLARDGVRDVAVISPAFAADCLETLQEINLEIRRRFTDAGGQRFHYIECLNDRADHINLLTELIEGSLGGWESRDQAVAVQSAM